MGTGAAYIIIRFPPGVRRYEILLQIRSLPLVISGIRDEGLKPLLACRIATCVETILVEGLAEKLDLRLGR
jgi:hypothetical protein